MASDESDRRVQSGFVDRAFAMLYETVHDVTLSMVDAIPEEHLDFRPMPVVRSFREHVVHISAVEHGMAMGAAGHGWGLLDTGYDPDDYRGRTSVWNLVLQTRDEVLSLAESISEARLHDLVPTPWGFEASPAQLLIVMRDHTNNHNGKLSVYMRMLDLEPPFFVSLTADTFARMSL